VLAARVDVLDVIAVAFIKGSVAFSVRSSENPMTAFSGVRSSWLIVDRNWSLNLLRARVLLCAQDGKGKGLNLFVGLFQFRGAFRDAFLQIVASLSQCLFILLDLPSISLKASIKTTSSPFHRLEARGRIVFFHERPLLQPPPSG